MKQPVTLTIAGSDCSGGAGIEADLKTFTALKVYGMAVITCVVAENPGDVHSIYPVSPNEVENQLRCCLSNMNSVHIKTGMLYSTEIISRISSVLDRYKRSIAFLTVDPVMVATSGKRLLKEKSVEAMKKFIRRHADLVTPNLDEAEILAGIKIKSAEDMKLAGKIISEKYSVAVLIKGGHLRTAVFASDYIINGHEKFWVNAKWIRGIKTHGTGCTYSAAITANLANGKRLKIAISFAKKYLTRSIKNSVRFPKWMALRHF